MAHIAIAMGNEKVEEWLTFLQSMSPFERNIAKEIWRRAIFPPARVAARVVAVLRGDYGDDARSVACSILSRYRGNNAAALIMLVAALEWGCPPREARQIWRTLPGRTREQIENIVMYVAEESKHKT